VARRQLHRPRRPVRRGAKDEKATVDRVAALTAIILDIDSGDTEAKRSFATAALGRPSLIVASGGKTDAGTPKLHLYWMLNEPSDEVERVAALRKRLAQMVGGDPSFGRATQVVRIPGTVHAKNGKAAVCAIVDRCDVDYNLDDLAEVIEAMLPMAGSSRPRSTPAA
jgi:putative DNA primase/helicase